MAGMEQAFDEEDEVIYDKTTLLQRQPPKRASRRPDHSQRSQRSHILRLASLILLFVCLGISLAIPGPTLTCFEYLTHSEEHLVSCLFVGRAGGVLVASLLTQLLLDIVPADCLSVVGLLLLSVAHFFIPWSERVWWLVGAFALQGAAIGLVLSGALALVRLLYGKRHLNYRHFFLVALAVGCVLTPFLVMPFEPDVATPPQLNISASPLPVRVRRAAPLSSSVRRGGVGPPPVIPSSSTSSVLYRSSPPTHPTQPSPNTTTSQPALDKSTISQVVSHKNTTSQPASFKSTTFQPTLHESTTSQPALDKSTTPQPSLPSSTTSQPAASKSATSKPASNKSMTSQSISTNSSTSQSILLASTTPMSASDKSTTPKPSSNESVTSKATSPNSHPASFTSTTSQPASNKSSTSPPSSLKSSTPLLAVDKSTSSQPPSDQTTTPESQSKKSSTSQPTSNESTMPQAFSSSTTTPQSVTSSPSSPSSTPQSTAASTTTATSPTTSTAASPGLPHGGVALVPGHRPRPSRPSRRKPSLQERYHHLVGRISSLRPVQRVYLSLGALCLLACLLCLHLCCACRRVPRLPAPTLPAEAPALFGRRRLSPSDLLFLASLLALALLLAGLEVTLGNYLYAWARRERPGWSPLTCLLLSATFWVGVALGRLPLLLVGRCRRSGPSLLLLVHLLLLPGAGLLLLLHTKPALLWLGVAAAGVALGPAPAGLELWLSGGLSGPEQRWLGTLAQVAAGLGEATIPVLAAVLHQVGEQPRALWVMAVACGVAAPSLFGLAAALVRLRGAGPRAGTAVQEEDEELLAGADSDDPEDGTFALRKLRSNGRPGQQRLLGVHDDDELDLH